MRSGVIPFHGPVTPAPQPNWQGQLDDWGRLVGRCGSKPGLRRVHGLRVATLRLVTELEVWLRGRPDREPAVRVARRWMREAERLRKVLSPVRDADVSLGMLAGLRGPGADEASTVSPESRDCLDTIARLQRRVERRRTVAGRKLTVALKAQGEQFIAAGRALEQALGEPGVCSTIDCEPALRTLATELDRDAACLSADVLHDFRKRAKAGRYLAELVAVYDPRAQRQVVRFKAIQAAAGQWHDWLTLADEAARMARGGAAESLARLLAGLAERSLAEALAVCRREAAGLHREGLAADPPRRPVASAVPPVTAQRYDRNGRALPSRLRAS